MFAHESEEMFADVLDTLELEWEYEPTVFIIKEVNGRVKRAFRPDFYLPDLDLYIEISTCTNRRRKRRKVEAAQERYPDANIILLLSDRLNEIFTEYAHLWSTT
jgi:hypothetical protein